MDVFKICFVIGFLKSTTSLKVYEWQNDWGSDVSTREFAQVHEVDKTITHYATDEGVPTKSSPAISFYDYNFQNADFKKGIMAIRPLVSAGNQVCFISSPRKQLSGTINAVINRHGMTVSAPSSSDSFKLKTLFPSDLDPLTIQSIADFCNVNADHIFYLEPVNTAKSFNEKLKIHGLFGRLVVGIPNKLVDTVFDFQDNPYYCKSLNLWFYTDIFEFYCRENL